MGKIKCVRRDVSTIRVLSIIDFFLHYFCKAFPNATRFKIIYVSNKNIVMIRDARDHKPAFTIAKNRECTILVGPMRTYH